MAGSTRWRKHTHQLQHVDGVMLGRAAYADPYLMADVDRALFGASEPPPSRLDVLDRFMPYVADEISRGTRLNQMTRHILGLSNGQPHARAFRWHFAETAYLDGAGVEVLAAARRSAVGGRRAQAVAAEQALSVGVLVACKSCFCRSIHRPLAVACAKASRRRRPR